MDIPNNFIQNPHSFFPMNIQNNFQPNPAQNNNFTNQMNSNHNLNLNAKAFISPKSLLLYMKDILAIQKFKISDKIKLLI